MQSHILKRGFNRPPPARRGGGRAMRVVLLLCTLIVGAWSLPAVAGVTPVVSRVVIDSNTAEESLQVFNVNTYPVLVQAWVDDGRIDAVPQESKAPIIALPPIFRMSAGEQTSVRLINTGAPLPADRESVFWLNLYEIPATPKAMRGDEQTVTITMRTQIKVFVRPAGKLPYPATELPARLAFSLSRASGDLVLAIDNPTPYHASIGAVRIALGDAPPYEAGVDMIAPFSRAEVKLDAPAGRPGEPAKLTFALIGDDGAYEIGERDLAIDRPSAGS